MLHEQAAGDLFARGRGVGGGSEQRQGAAAEGDEMFQDGVSHDLSRGGRRASVQCYAIEGRYPPSLEYLAQHYGIQIDKERYDVFYSGFASNFMPDITVNLHEESPGGGK